MQTPEISWDVVIVGAGPAGCSAAMVLARSHRRVLLLDEGRQRNLRSRGLHNFITRDGILPAEFLHLAFSELARYPVDYINCRVASVSRQENGFLISDSTGVNYTASRVLLATGVTDLVPDVPGMTELWGSCVFHCPFCDGYECKDSPTALYAQKYNGFGMALALRHLSAEVTLFTDGAHYLRPGQRRQLAERGIGVVTKRVSHLVHHKNKLTAVALADGREIPCRFLFTHHGHRVNQLLLQQLGCRCTKKGAAITNRHQQTNIPGVYVAGDASYDMHFVIVAAGEGVKAGAAIHDDLLRQENARLQVGDENG